MSYLDGCTAVFPFDNSLQSLELAPVYIPDAPIDYLIDITLYNTDTAGLETLHVCTGQGCVYGGNYYEPCVINPGRMTNLLFGEGRTWGESTLGFGEVVLNNVDGHLDRLRKYGYGRDIVIRQFIAGAAVLLTSCGTEQPTFTNSEIAIRIKDPAIVINVPVQPNKYGGTNVLPNGVDGTADIQGRPKPLLIGRPGTAADGFNGTPVCVNTSKLIYQVDDTASKVASESIINGGFDSDTTWSKDAGWSISGGQAVSTGSASGNIYQDIGALSGEYYLVTFTVASYTSGSVGAFVGGSGGGTQRSAVGTYTEIIARNNGTIAYIHSYSFVGSIDNVSYKRVTPLNTTELKVNDKGVEITRGADYTSVADMEANPPAELTVRWFPGGGYFRLGSSPIGQVTFSAVEGATAADRTAAQVAKRVALRVLTSNDLIAQDFIDLDTANSAETGIYITSEANIPQVLTEVLGNVGGWWGFDANKKLNVGRLEAPTGTPVAELTDVEIIDIEHQATQDEGRGVPATQVSVNYAKNYTVQDAGTLAGAAITGSWTQVALSGAGPSGILSAAYGNGCIMGAGSSTRLHRSVDLGKTWGVSVFLPGTVTGIEYGNNMWLASGGTTNYYTSSDNGNTWDPRTCPSGISGKPIFAGSKWFWGGSSFYYSTDGISWTPFTPGFSLTNIKYGNNIYSSVTGSGSAPYVKMHYSTDGITWYQSTFPGANLSVITSYEKCFDFGNNRFVFIVPTTTDFFTSLDGITWTRDTLPRAATGVWLNWIYDAFVIAGPANFQLASYDGLTWLDLPVNNTPQMYIVLSVLNSSVGFDLSGGYSTYAYLRGRTVFNELVSRVSKQYRTVTASDATVKTIHPLAASITFNTGLVTTAAAQAEADRQLAMRKVVRDYLRVQIKPGALTTIPDLGKVVKITYPRYGYDSGKLMRFLGYEMHLDTDDITLTFWG